MTGLCPIGSQNPYIFDHVICSTEILTPYIPAHIFARLAAEKQQRLERETERKERDIYV